MRGPSFKKLVMRHAKIKNPKNILAKEINKAIKSGRGCLVVFIFGTIASTAAIAIVKIFMT